MSDNDLSISKKQRNKLKKSILRKLSKDKRTQLFNSKTGEQEYYGINLQMVMQCVFDGLNKCTNKGKDNEA